jgi:2-methylisocitrate lyase-like PEP mutase family enzyme
VPELASLGVRRVSVGGSFAFAALGAVVVAAEELRGAGTYEFLGGAAVGRDAAVRAFGR